MRAILAIASAAAATGILATGCQAPRTAPYTQPTPAEFLADDSDEEAIEIVDALIGQLGGAKAWDEVKQIRWEQRVMLDDEVRGWFLHSWDRWNSRHRWESPHMPTVAAAEAEDDPSLIQATVAMYRLHDKDRNQVTFAGQPVARADAGEIVDAAKETFDSSHYFLTGYHKLKDPGVKLAYQGESEPMDGFCEPACSIIHVSFDPEVGDDSYIIHVNTETQRPDIIATQTGAGQLAYGLTEWVEVAGLSFPVSLQNLGNKSERIEHANVEIGEVDSSLYSAPAR